MQSARSPDAQFGSETRVAHRWSAFMIGATVYGLWAVMTVALLLLVTTYGDNLPGPDEWSMVPIWLGKEPLTLSYLFAPYAEHVLPLSKAFLVAMARITNSDFRSGQFASVFVLSAAALALIWTARQLRGRLSLADVFFPLVLLHLGHRENVLQGWTLHNALFAALAIAVLILLLNPKQRFTMPRTISLGCSLVLLAYTGAGGQVVSLIVTVWFLGNCLLMRNRSAGRQRSIATVGAVLACASLANIRFLRGFDLTPLVPALPWLALVLGITFLALPPHSRPSPGGRGESAPASLVRTRLLRIGTCLGAIVLAIGLAWLLSLPEAACEAIGLSACLWAAYRGVIRYRQPHQRAKLDGLMIIGLALAAAVLTNVFRPVDRECLWMVAGCMTLSLAAWSLMRIKHVSGRIGALASFLILTLITLGPSYRLVPSSPSVWAALRGAIMFLSTAFGATGTNHWPYSGWIIVILWVAAAVVLKRRQRLPLSPVLGGEGQGEGGALAAHPCAGLPVYFAAFAVLALALGWGRAGFVGWGTGVDLLACGEPRYALLSLPSLCAIYLVIGMEPIPWVGRLAQFTIAGLLLLWAPDNFHEGVVAARHIHEKNRRFLEDMSDGKPLMYVIHHHRWWAPHGWSWSAYVDMKEGMRLFHDAKKPGFAQLSMDWPEVNQEIVFDRLNPKAQKPGNRARSGEGSASIRLDRPQRIYAIMVRFEPLGDSTGWHPSMVRIHWPGGPPEGEDIVLSRFPDDLTACAWVDREIDQIDVDWSPAELLRTARIGCLVPAAWTPLELRIGLPNPFFKF